MIFFTYSTGMSDKVYNFRAEMLYFLNGTRFTVTFAVPVM